MTIVGLLRHGPTAWNRDKRIQGVRDVPLDTDSFDPGPWLTLLDAHGPWDRVVTSPLSRARETARLLFPDLPPRTDAGLAEQDWGQWTGRTIRELRTIFPGAVEDQEARGWDFAPPGGESRRSVLTRALRAIETSCSDKDGGRILLITHFGVIMALLNHLHGTSFLPGTSTPIAKRALHLLERSEAGLRVLQTNLVLP